MVTGANATEAGFLMIPMMAALLISSIGSGWLVSKFGRYKWMPAGAAGAGEANSFTPAMVRELPEAARQVIISGYNDALTPVFLFMVPLIVVAVILLCFVTEKPLATTIEHDILAETLETDGATYGRC